MTKILALLRHLLGDFDPYGYEHGARVRDLAVRLAERSGVLPASQLMKDIKTAAEIHDIGKVGIPESIRRNTGLYLPAERTAMEQHPLYGAEILNMVVNGTINAQVVRFIRHHHEDWCGAGYPDGLKGDAIPIGARIIRIADSYDAITHDRGYRRALSPTEALKELEDFQVQAEFADPALLRLFLEMMKESL